MHYVLLAISCSVLVSVLLKLAKRYHVDIGQAIAWNYLAATGLTLWLLQPSLQPIQHRTAPWLTWLALGGLLPTIFLAMAASVRSSGIVRSDAAQRLSLLIPLLAAFLLFNEPLSQQKLIGSVLGLLGLFGMVWRNPEQSRTSGAVPWLWPLLVFVGYGVIDVLFKRVAAAGVPLGSSLLVVFCLAYRPVD
jgi:drug/metabolite transporter (DMT)-like permease